MEKLNHKNGWLFLKTFAFVVVIVIAKLVIHLFGMELLSINNLFSGIIAANVFLMGFLLSGVLADFKESEKIPGEIANSLSTIYDEFLFLYDNKKDETAKQGMVQVLQLSEDFTRWFFRKEKTKTLLLKIQDINTLYYLLENKMQANFIVRLKNETAALKKYVIRTDTIRDTDFISSGYLIASTVTFLLCVGLVFSKIEPFYESLFFVGVISFLMIFLNLLIHDLDNPFGYNEKYSAENVSLYPLDRFINEIKDSNRERDIM